MKEEYKKEYKKISSELLKEIGCGAWSVENMEAHEATGRSMEYIGSATGSYLSDKKSRRVSDYYRDSEGELWFKDRAMLPNGSVVSMEVYLFGRELRKPRRKQKK